MSNTCVTNASIETNCSKNEAFIRSEWELTTRTVRRNEPKTLRKSTSSTGQRCLVDHNTKVTVRRSKRQERVRFYCKRTTTIYESIEASKILTFV